MKETLLERQSLYKGSLISLYKDTVRCSNGITTSREIIDHSPAVVIIPIDKHGNITLIKQYRHAINDILIECPAGCVEPNEELHCRSRHTRSKLIWCYDDRATKILWYRHGKRERSCNSKLARCKLIEKILI